jgi:hypothetical protein
MLRRVRWPNGSIPPSAVCFFQEGNRIACVRGDHINLAESPAGFGTTRRAAEADLERNERREEKRKLNMPQAGTTEISPHSANRPQGSAFC